MRATIQVPSSSWRQPSPEDLASYHRAELARWGEVIRRASITADS